MDAPRESRTDDRRTPPAPPPSLERGAVARLDHAAPTIDRIWRRHERSRELRVAAVVLGVVAVLAFMAFNPLRDPQRVLDVYAPGVRLGAPVTSDVWTRLRLRPSRVAPQPLAEAYLGAAPPVLVGEGPPSEDGVGPVVIAIGPVPAPLDASPPKEPPPVSRAMYSVPSPGVAARVQERLVKLLGRRFERRCFDQGVSTLYWEGNRHGGALLVVPTTRDAASWRTPFAARLVLGARRWEARLPREAKCRRD